MTYKKKRKFPVQMNKYRVYQMIGAVSSGHNGFGYARRSMFPTWNETAGIEVLIACAIPLPSPLSLGP
jgi:hypothetical protein